MTRIFAASLAMCLLARPVLAECVQDQTLFLRCDMEHGGKTLELCWNDEQATYRFGPKGGTPELALGLPMGAGATHTPWPGIGRTIWEAMRLRNTDVVYEVYGGFDRMDAATPDAPDSRFGGVIVLQDGKGEIAHLKCRAGAVEFTY